MQISQFRVNNRNVCAIIDFHDSMLKMLGLFKQILRKRQHLMIVIGPNTIYQGCKKARFFKSKNFLGGILVFWFFWCFSFFGFLFYLIFRF